MYRLYYVIAFIVCAACTTPASLQNDLARQGNLLPYTQNANEQRLCREGLAETLGDNVSILSMKVKEYTGFIGNSPVPVDSSTAYYVTTDETVAANSFVFNCIIKYTNRLPSFSLADSKVGQEGYPGSFEALTKSDGPPPTAPIVEAEAPAASMKSKRQLTEPFLARLASPEANQECLDMIRDNLLDPTSLVLTSDFEPDPLWLNYGTTEDPNRIKFSAKMLARNRGGNIAPFRALCEYAVESSQLQFIAGLSYSP